MRFFCSCTLWDGGVPVILAGTATGLMKKLLVVGRWSGLVERIAGMVMLGAGLYYLWLA